MSHFVYLYRDQTGKPCYVGYGESSERALSHMTQTHNLALETLLQSQNLKLEIAGPFGDKETALAVETALISALSPDANIARGKSEHRFRPIGVPVEFASRWELPPLQTGELEEVLGAQNSKQFLCVLIRNFDFGDGRGTFDPANPPSDAKILERVQKWWALIPKSKQWSENPSQCPAIMLGVHGRPGAQFIIASLSIDRNGWKNVVPSPDNSSRIEVPILASNLDAAGLRGRRISREVGLRFNLDGLVLFPYSK